MPSERETANSTTRVPGDVTAPADESTLATGVWPESGGEPDVVLERGTELGRYLILDELGAGGMGRVYTGYDPELDRRIAIKLMRRASLGTEGRNWILREAQSMARLAHRNVVRVFDVGLFDGQIFIAMEYVPGVTLSDWLADKPRTWVEIVRVMVQAGRGLAAAHAAGLIHRDVKPSNILVDQQGEARVMDFGVARPAGDAPTARRADSGEPADDEGASDRPKARDTVGTPAYMAPEQRQGVTDARSDQYSFCVTLFEALFGDRPQPMDRTTGAGGVPRSTRSRRLPRSGSVRTRPAQARGPVGARVPNWVRTALRRGLDAEPHRRYESMDALLKQLSRDPTARRRRLLTAAAATAALGSGGVVAIVWRADADAPCRGAEQQVASAWDESVKRTIRNAFAASGRSYALDTYARIERLLDAQADAWVEMRTEACQATRLEGRQSEEMLDLRMRCLDQRLGELRALTDVFARDTDAAVVDRAVPAAYGLTDLAGCADRETLTAAVPPPSDPATRARVDELDASLQRAAALEQAGKFKEGLALARSIAEASVDIDYLPLRARALYRLGSLQTEASNLDEADRSLRGAATAAAASHDDAMLADLALDQIYAVGYQRARHAEAVAIARFAEALVIAAGNQPARRARGMRNLGVVRWAEGDYDAALAALERAKALLESTPDIADAALPSTLNVLAVVLWELGRLDEARDEYERVIAISERTLGPRHVAVSRPLNNLGLVLAEEGRLEEAEATYQRALEIAEPTLGSANPDVAMMLTNIGQIALQKDEYKRAIELCGRALRVAEPALGANHPGLAYHLACLGNALIGSRQAQQSLPILERALAIREKNAVGPALIGRSRFTLARALWEAGEERPRAMRLAEQALREFASASGHRDKDRAEVETWLREHRSP